MIHSNQNIDILKKDGLVKISNFLNKKQTNDISSIILKYRPTKASNSSYFASNYKNLFYKLLKLNFVSFFENLSIINVCNSLGLKKFSEQHFKKKTHLTMVDAYYNSKDDNQDKPVIPWHTDQAYSGANINEIKEFVNPDDYTLKFFIYLTDVYRDNGCMSYIPGSHKITYLIRKGIYDGKLDYSPYWSASQIIEFISYNKNKEYIMEHLEEKIFFNEFLEKLKMLKENDDNHLFDYSMKAGDAIIFNEGIIHKGSRIAYSDRMILRFHFKPNLINTSRNNSN